MATIKGTNKHDHLVGTAGADTILGFAAGDDLLGMGGIDKISGGGGNDTLSGGSGNDILRGGEGDDILYGGAGNDTLYGDAGDDILNGGGGNDRFVAGIGHDKFAGGAGVDTVSYAASAMKIGVYLADGNGDNGAQLDTFAGIENVDGTAFGDTIEGNGAANVLRGLGGNDFLHGGGGNDRLEGGNGDDQLTGDAGADAFFGDAGNDWVLYFHELSSVNVNLATGIGGGAAAGDTYHDIETVEGTIYGDTITGDGLDNTLYGVDGSDTLSGGGGNDTIYGGNGFDIIVGGNGNDRLVPKGDEDIPVSDALSGGANDDTVDYYNAGSAVTVDLTTPNAKGGGGAAGDTYSGIENVNGSIYGDTLTPASGGRASGDWGADTIRDSTGTEVLRGGRGLDKLDDNVGGDDGLTDIFVLEVGLDQDTIYGFDHAVDRFWLPDAMFDALGHNAQGTLAAGTLVNATSFSPTLGQARLFHDTSPGDNSLWYYDGGLGAPIQIATLSGFSGSLTTADFLIIPGF